MSPNRSVYRPERMEYLTDAERRAVLAYIEFGGYKTAANALGISVGTVKTALAEARRKYGARTMAQLAVKLYPALGEFYRLPCDK